MKNEKEQKGYFDTRIWMSLSFPMEYKLPVSLGQVMNNPTVRVEIDSDDGELTIHYPHLTTKHYPRHRPHFYLWEQEWEIEEENFLDPEVPDV